MTPDEFMVLLDEVAGDIEVDIAAAFARYQQLVRGGMAPREAVETVMGEFRGELAGTLATAFTQALGTSVGTAAVLEWKIGEVTLSQAIYVEALALGSIVQGIVERHAQGFQSARDLALELYEGYGFKPVEVLQFTRRSDLIPRYIKDALLPDLAGDFDTAFARLTVADLSTPALRAAYADVLRAIDALQAGKGEELLTRKLRVAFEEKARFFANRIAQTELARAYGQRQAEELMRDTDVRFVQWRMSQTHPREDICDYFAEVDKWGLGPGVYPKQVAPTPLAHPFCRCVLAPRLDLYGKTPRLNPGADEAYFSGMDEQEAARVAGSRAKLERIFAGEDPMAIHNERIPEAYQVKFVPEVAAEYVSR